MMLDARGLFFKALDCLDAKDFQRAESLFLETLRLTPGSVPTLNNLAVAQYEQKRQCAELWASKKFPASKTSMGGEIYKHDRIRLAYVSSDCREHATAYLMARVFELHDRTRFEVSAISIGINDSSAIRHRLECAFDKFVEASELNDFEIASKIRKDEIDLLIDRSSSLHRKDRLSPRHISSQRL